MLNRKLYFACSVFALGGLLFTTIAAAHEKNEAGESWVQNLTPEEVRALEAESATTIRAFSTAAIRKSRGEDNHRRISVRLPLNANIIDIRASMKNAPWPNNCDLGSTDFKQCPIGSGECPIGWSKVRDQRVSSNRTVSANFHNWSHCNLRTGRLTVIYRTPRE